MKKFREILLLIFATIIIIASNQIKEVTIKNLNILLEIDTSNIISRYEKKLDTAKIEEKIYVDRAVSEGANELLAKAEAISIVDKPSYPFGEISNIEKITKEKISAINKLYSTSILIIILTLGSLLILSIVDRLYKKSNLKLKNKLRKLENLRDSEIITLEEYHEKRSVIIRNNDI